MSDKVRENRARRAAARQGLVLMKSRRRDPRAIGFGTYELADARTGRTVARDGAEYGLTLDAVEAFLRGDER